MPRKGDRKELCLNGHPRTPDNLYKNGSCKTCFVDYHRKWVLKNPHKNGRIKRQYRLSKKFNLSNAWFDETLAAQNNKCAICLREFTLEDKNRTPHLDHCHVTMKPRALLCDWCNKGLGNFQDDSSRLEKAAEYLKKYREGNTIVG